jgi:hypothetical protein
MERQVMPTQDPWEQAAAEFNKGGSKPASTTTAAPSDDWKLWQQQQQGTDSSAKPLNDQASDYIADPSMAKDSGWRGQLERFGQGTAEALTNPFLHPIDTARALMTPGTIQGDADMLRNAAKNPANTLGQIAGGAILGHVGGGLSEGLKDFATTDPQAAAMRGLRIPAGSKNAQSILGKVETAKPYLQGADSLEDLQSRLPAAKSEVYGPYNDFIEANRHASIDGPSGPSTIGDLYDRDKAITAQLGQIKNDPMAMQQAAQKGLNQADLIAEQKAIREKLFPAAEQAGVDATGINKTYGALKGVEKQVAGKNTLIVPDEPMGLGRIQNLKLRPDLGLLKEIKPFAQDILNGRFWSGNPVDLGIKDAFANAGPKPDLGRYEPLPRLQLPSQASPITVPEPHQFTAPYTPKTAASLLDLGIPEKVKPTVRRYGVRTGTDTGASK